MLGDEREMWQTRAGRLLRVFTPFTILFVGLAILNLKLDDPSLSQQSSGNEATEIATQPAKEPTDTAIPTNIQQTPIATAIANAVESSAIPLEPTVPAKPTLLPGEVATLSGPPSESQFSLSSPLAFYWHPTQQLLEGQAYAIAIMGEDNEELVGLLSEPNLGSGYQVHFLPEELGFSAGKYYWQVRLLQPEGDVLLGSSEQRSINLVDAK